MTIDDPGKRPDRSSDRGVVPAPSIPRLDGEPIRGEDGQPLTMDEQARMVTPEDPRHPDYRPNLEPAPPHRTHPRFNQPVGTPLTPDQASGPGVMKGVGAAYQDNQPFVQAPDGRRLSQKTLKSLEEVGQQELEKFQEQAETTQKEEAAKKAQEKPDAVAKAMADLGLDDPEMLRRIEEESKGKLERKEVRDAIEARLKPISIEQMLDDGEARQEVPIVRPTKHTGGLEATYRTVRGDENLEIHRLMRGDAHLGGNFVRDKYLLLRLTAGLFALNGDPLPSHMNQAGEWDPDKFAAKLKVVGRYPLPMLSVLSINYSWFADRAEDVFLDVGGLKNG